MPKYDISKLLHSRSQGDRFINKLTVDEGKSKEMRAARTKVRSKLKSAFTQAKSNSLYLSRLDQDLQAAFKNVGPRFWPQGSFAYGTQNIPAQTPPQQLDIDDGTYLPIELFEDKPVVLKEIFFDIVDTALRELARDEGWEFKEKNTCARLILDPITHLDVPLYVIPVERFEKLQKAVASTILDESIQTTEDDINYRRLLAEKEVYLALRDNTHWRKSDPIRIQAWYENEQEMWGYRLNRICRYLKAWRDFQWKDGGPSSIALMVCVTQVFNESKDELYSDSIALLNVCERLPELLKEVRNPVATDEIIFPRGISTEEHETIIETAKTLSSEVCNALQSGADPTTVVNTLITQWGDRIPYRPDWIETASAVAAAIVSETPAIKQPKPHVETMRSGYRSG